MKELSIEEKAEAYDEVREKIAIRFGSNVADEIFSQFEMSEDERIKEWLINLVKGHIEWLEDRIREQLSNGQIYGGALVKAKNSLAWLENQGEQKPAEWSEEDESMLQNILDCLKNEWRKLPTDIIKYESWLKSLKPQNTWKPSEEQINALEYYIYSTSPTATITKGTIYGNLMVELLEQLKKLREG